MVSILSLWLPILLSAVAVFLVSWLIHAVLKYHQTDFARLPSEDEIADSLRRYNIPPGEYMMPYGGGMEAMKDPAWIAKMERGPVAMMTVMPARKPTMGAELVQWFIYCLVVSIFAAYIAGRALTAGAAYPDVFRFVGATAFIGYTLAQWQNTIWYHRKLSTSVKNTIDGLVYALITAGMFGWLWPA
ncbi:MAG: hypothetical protein ACT4O1_05470 [Gemmatimonadota bacterium]